MMKLRTDLTFTTKKRVFRAVAISLLAVGSSFVIADEETRFGLLKGSEGVGKVIAWEKWTGEKVAAAGENFTAGTWEDFSGENPDSAIAIALADWEAALRKNKNGIREADLLMEFAIPLFPETTMSGDSQNLEVEELWSKGAEGAFNEHFRALAETLVSKGWGGAHLRPVSHLESGRGASAWGLRGKPERWPQFKAYWKQIHETMMNVEGADFKWVWCSALDGGETEFDPIEAAWPGDDFVDVVSVVALDESARYYRQRYESEEPTHDWFTLRRWTWEEKAYGVVRDPNTGEVLSESVPSLSSFYDLAKAKGKRFAISEWGVVRGDRFPQDEIWGGNDNALYVEAMSQWVNGREVDYALYSEVFSSSKRFGNRDHSILPDFWNRGAGYRNAIHPEVVGNPLSSLQYLECFHKRLPEGYKRSNYDAPVLASETFREGVSSLWELSGPWETKRGALHVTNENEEEQAVAKMRTPSINRQSMEFQLLVASEGDGVYLQVGPWRLRVSLLSDGRLGLVSLFDTDAAEAVSTSLVGKPYVIGETYVPIKMDINPSGVTVRVGDELLVNHEAGAEREMSMDIKIIAGSHASVFLRSLEVCGGEEPDPAQ